jgi:hypothetical protein
MEAFREAITCFPNLESTPPISRITESFFRGILTPSSQFLRHLKLRVLQISGVDTALLKDPDFARMALVERHFVYTMPDAQILRHKTRPGFKSDVVLQVKALEVIANEAGCAALTQFAPAYVECIHIEFHYNTQNDSDMTEALMHALYEFSRSQEGSTLSRIEFGTINLSAISVQTRKHIPFLLYLFDEFQSIRRDYWTLVSIDSLEITRADTSHERGRVDGAGERWYSWKVDRLQFGDRSNDPQVWRELAAKIPYIKTLTTKIPITLDNQTDVVSCIVPFEN